MKYLDTTKLVSMKDTTMTMTMRMTTMMVMVKKNDRNTKTNEKKFYNI